MIPILKKTISSPLPLTSKIPEYTLLDTESGLRIDALYAIEIVVIPNYAFRWKISDEIIKTRVFSPSFALPCPINHSIPEPARKEYYICVCVCITHIIIPTRVHGAPPIAICPLRASKSNRLISSFWLRPHSTQSLSAADAHATHLRRAVFPALHHDARTVNSSSPSVFRNYFRHVFFFSSSYARAAAAAAAAPYV